MRCFIGANLNRSASMLERIAPPMSDGTARPGSYHVTLTNWDDLDNYSVKRVAAGIERFRHYPFPLTVDRALHFPGKDGTVLYAAGFQREASLRDMRAELESSLGMEFWPNFSPHVTVLKPLGFKPDFQQPKNVEYLDEPFDVEIRELEFVRTDSDSGHRKYNTIVRRRLRE